MGRLSNGTYQAPGGTTAVPNTLISSSAFNALEADIGNEITNSLDRNGRGGMNAPLAMNGNRINGLANGLLATDAATVGQLGQYSQSVRSAAVGGSDTATTTDGVIYWNYSYSGTKTQSIPAASSFLSGQTLTIKDRYGDAGTNPISITPVTGTIDDAAKYVINEPKMSVTLSADAASNNWIVL